MDPQEKKLVIRLRKFARICPIAGYREELIKVGTPVVVQTDRGIELGEIIAFTRGLPRALIRDVKLKKVIRYATEEDLQKGKELAFLEQEAISIGLQKIKEHELPIKIINVEYLFDVSRVILYYKVKEGESAPNLRDFTRDMAATLKARVDVSQISSRDGARLFGGLGPCGRPLCCAVWLEKPRHVTVKAVKDQGLSLSPTRTSGICGRLLCCLEYEKK